MQLEANLAASESARIGGERDLFAQRQDLGREIGLRPEEIAALPLPSDPFPSLGPEEVPPDAEAPGFIALALRHRADLEAARQRETELELQRRAAENALKPQLDLILAPNYSGIAAGGGGRRLPLAALPQRPRRGRPSLPGALVAHPQPARPRRPPAT